MKHDQLNHGGNTPGAIVGLCVALLVFFYVRKSYKDKAIIILMNGPYMNGSRSVVKRQAQPLQYWCWMIAYIGLDIFLFVGSYLAYIGEM